MSSRRDWDYLEDMRVAIERIQRYLTSLSRAEFEQDEKTQDAVIRNLEIIGEAAKNVSADELPPLLPLVSEIQDALASTDQ